MGKDRRFQVEAHYHVLGLESYHTRLVIFQLALNQCMLSAESKGFVGASHQGLFNIMVDKINE